MINEIALLSKTNVLILFDYLLLGVSCNSFCGESSNTVEILISHFFKESYLIIF